MNRMCRAAAALIVLLPMSGASAQSGFESIDSWIVEDGPRVEVREDSDSVVDGLPTCGGQCGMHPRRNGLQIGPIQEAIGKEVPEDGVRPHQAVLIKGKCTDGSRNRGKFCAITDRARGAAPILWCPSRVPHGPTVGLPCIPIATKVDRNDRLRLKQRLEDDDCGVYKGGQVRLGAGKLLLERGLEGVGIRGMRGTDDIRNNVACWRDLCGHRGAGRSARGTDKCTQG